MNFFDISEKLSHDPVSWERQPYLEDLGILEGKIRESHWISSLTVKPVQWRPPAIFSIGDHAASKPFTVQPTCQLDPKEGTNMSHSHSTWNVDLSHNFLLLPSGHVKHRCPSSPLPNSVPWSKAGWRKGFVHDLLHCVGMRRPTAWIISSTQTTMKKANYGFWPVWF